MEALVNTVSTKAGYLEIDICFWIFNLDFFKWIFELLPVPVSLGQNHNILTVFLDLRKIKRYKYLSQLKRAIHREIEKSKTKQVTQQMAETA